jgi:hypothetical protein
LTGRWLEIRTVFQLPTSIRRKGRKRGLSGQDRLAPFGSYGYARRHRVVDCQFARATRLLGRTIGTQDLNSAQRRMKDNWAPTAKARDATWYALLDSSPEEFIPSELLSRAIEAEPGLSDNRDGYAMDRDILEPDFRRDMPAPGWDTEFDADGEIIEADDIEASMDRQTRDANPGTIVLRVLFFKILRKTISLLTTASYLFAEIEAAHKKW